MPFDAHYAFREELIDYVERDLVGYASVDEEIQDPPITRYASGVLFPQDSGQIDPDTDDEAESGYDGETPPDPPVAMANRRYPTSMGITFAVDPALADQICVVAEAGRYEKFDEDGQIGWRRVALGPFSKTISVTDPTEGDRETLIDGLTLFSRVRKPDASGAVSITLVLINSKTAPPTGGRDELAFFQPKLVVTPKQSGIKPFVGRPRRGNESKDSDIRSYRLLYRNAKPFAVGHGCSADWECEPEAEHASEIRTTFVPRYELLLADSPKIDMRGLSMKELAEGGRSDAIQSLRQFCDQYQSWIGGLENRLSEFEGELRKTAEEHIESCKEAQGRMRAGVDVLADTSDDKPWQAFQLANKAMLLQRARSDWLRSDRPTPEPVLDARHCWYPFQLAFIMVALRGVADPRSEDRKLSDLLWFPTGGGKTEAYLGLIALTIFLRRMRHGSQGGGVTVIMRYTLRLLTLQQFERAAMLMCACEVIRRQSRSLGDEPISIGLWVGEGATPNKLADAKKTLAKIAQSQMIDKKNPVQLRRCPWCGEPLDHRNYYVANHDPRLVITCKQPDCEFEKELPVYVVDEDIYRKRPTLIIATVDKFASLPWRDQVANLFNRGAASAKPPELIVQDELHLISGPLGTLAGLYETAVDILCTKDGIGPKIVASTATIRRAESQGRGLFNREVRQFPPPGLDASDSFFAAQASRDKKASRMYFGVMAPATSQTTLLVRVYAALLQGAQDLDAEDEVRDAYWSLVGYFNSLRVLGGARMQVQDDVAEDRIPYLASLSSTDPRPIDNRIELTSREPSGDIPSHLKRMELFKYRDPEAIDVILATNMISVGVDVDRLGLMAVMGQPQSTSEYIQATSRVGRKHPGLVGVMFNGAKSRDRSHYESFRYFHSALYRQVESTSVTPFSARSRDRGLHAVFIALARHLIPQLTDNASARNIEQVLSQLEGVKQIILDRVIAVTESTEDRDLAATQIDEIVDQWQRVASETPDLRFSDFQNPDRALLAGAADENINENRVFPTLWSLRDVDAASNLYQL
ncbi:MAG: helicase-related protein [Phycisphaeraceae bacterium]